MTMRTLPGLLSILVVLLALGTVVHALVSLVRRRRRDLAVLKTLGFLPRQVSATVACQATAFAAAAVLAGLPVGVAVGRWAWRLVADQLGVVSKPAVPSVQALAVAGAAGSGQRRRHAWDIIKWPVLLLVVSFLFTLLYWASPNAKQGFRWVTPGGILAVVVWVAASVAFAVYVANFNSFLVWLWLSNTAILLGPS